MSVYRLDIDLRDKYRTFRLESFTFVKSPRLELSVNINGKEKDLLFFNALFNEMYTLASRPETYKKTLSLFKDKRKCFTFKGAYITSVDVKNEEGYKLNVIFNYDYVVVHTKDEEAEPEPLYRRIRLRK